MKRFLKVLAPLALCAILLAVSGCSSKTGKRFDIFDILGTVTTLAIYADYGDGAARANVDAAKAEIETALREIEHALSLSDPESDIARFNRAEAGETLEISRTAYEMLTEAKTLYTFTEGAYNPAVGRLTDLWGFSPRFYESVFTPSAPYDRADCRTRLPEQKYIDAFRTLTDFSSVELRFDGGAYTVTKPNLTATVDGDDTVYSMTLDLGGIGKGKAADRADAILAAHGLNEAYVSVGSSSIRLRENTDGTDWSVQLMHPRQSGNYAVVKAKNTSASTSGDYEHAYVLDGKRYCHIIDTESGAPIDNGVVTLSLFGKTATEGDALATALCVMGKEKALAFLHEKLPDCKYALVTENAQGELEFYTDFGEDVIEVTDRTIERKGRTIHVG